ncbi:MAG: hypothetical protein JXJ17_18790 [Anaerolineae bacterium]|nr:hypothetical protein [Anaerolineae bacterium]
MTNSDGFEQITSIKDARVVEARALASSSGRRQAGKCLLYGDQHIRWAIESAAAVEHIFFDASGDPPAFDMTMYAVSGGILKKITGTSYVISPVGVARTPPSDIESLAADFVLVLDDVRDPGNVGTIVRTVRAFGVGDVVLGGGESDPYSRKAIDAARGKVFETRFYETGSGIEAVRRLKSAGYQVAATSPRGPLIQSLAQLKPHPIALVVGNESAGISAEIEAEADLLIRIPMAGPVESLNVGVATGISVYELRLKLVLAMLTDTIRNTLGREVNVTGKMIQMALDRRLREVTDLTSTQAILLMVMACDGVMPLEQVEKDTSMYGGELDALLDPLVNGGMIHIDDRQGGYTLTEAGKQLIGQLWPVLEATEDALLDGLSDAERDQFRAALKQVQANCIKIIGEPPER